MRQLIKICICLNDSLHRNCGKIFQVWVGSREILEADKKKLETPVQLTGGQRRGRSWTSANVMSLVTSYSVRKMHHRHIGQYFSLRVPCQSATSECSPPLPGSDSAPKSVVGVSYRVFHSRLKTPFLQILSPVIFLSLYRTDFTVFIPHVYRSLWCWKHWSVQQIKPAQLAFGCTLI